MAKIILLWNFDGDQILNLFVRYAVAAMMQGYPRKIQMFLKDKNVPTISLASAALVPSTAATISLSNDPWVRTIADNRSMPSKNVMDRNIPDKSLMARLFPKNESMPTKR